MVDKKFPKKSTGVLQAPPAKKSKGKKGCLFWLVLLVLIAGGLFAFQKERLKTWAPALVPSIERMDALLKSFDPTFGLFKSEPPPVIEALPMIEIELPPAPEPKPTPKPKLLPIVGEKLNYIRVGGCMDKECRVQLLREIESLNLPTLVKRYRRQTLYWELVSKTAMNRSNAENRLVEIERHALSAPPPTLTKHRGEYRISLGEYPDKTSAVQMRSYLAQLYPDVDLPFDLVPRQRHFDMVYIYAGPFTSRFNAESVAELIRDKRFVQETFVTADP
ncbi:MAG: hypothetical protein RRB13_09285 [bacterium]|nr:hypothetical protein [bacterium]